MSDRSRIFPCLRYRNPHAAVTFLVAAFGFQLKRLDERADGTATHAELQLGDGFVFVTELDPAAVAAGRTVSGGAGSVYASIAYVDAHHDKAAAAGAVITEAPHDMAPGKREYACRDIEGYEWRFGSYDPFATEEV